MSRAVRLFTISLALYSCLAVAQQYKNGSKAMLYRISELNASTSALNQSIAYDLNDNVQIAGDAFAIADQPHGFMRDTGVAITWIPGDVTGRQTSNRAISSLGSVAGYIQGNNLPTQAFRWTSETGTSSLSIGDESAAFGINSTGDVAGSYRVGTDRRAFFWDRFGTTYDLGKLDDSSFAQTMAYAVNDSQQVVGAATTGDGYNHAFVWTPASGMRSLFPGRQNSGAFAISNWGRITGFLQDKKGGWEVFIYDLKTASTRSMVPSSTFRWPMGSTNRVSPSGSRMAEQHCS